MLPEMHKTIRMNGQEFAEKAELFKSWKVIDLKKLNIIIVEHKAQQVLSALLQKVRLKN